MNLDLIKPKIKIANVTPFGFTVMVNNEYPEDFVKEYKYYVDGNLISNGINQNTYKIKWLEEGTEHNVYVEVCTKDYPIKSNVESVKTATVKSGIRFNGSTYITTLNQSDIYKTGNDEYTIAMKVKINRTEQASVSWMGLWGPHENNEGMRCQFSDKSSIINPGCFDVDFTNYYDKWVDIVFTYNGGASKFYFNGQLVGSGVNKIEPYSTFRIGDSHGGERGIKAYMYSVKVWSKKLTDEEVNLLDMSEKNTTIQAEYLKLESRIK